MNHLSDLTDLEIEWSQDLFVLESYSRDLWPKKLIEIREKGPMPPSVHLVVWPRTTEQVQQVVRWADRADVSLYPYGAGSGVCGGTIPTQKDLRSKVIVDLKKMKKIREIDKESLTAWIEAGIIGENLERQLNEKGLTLGHFPSSIYCSSLGGYLAARSAGQLSTKYGKMEDMVLSLEFVLPDGRVTQTARAPRSAMGPDWTQLLLGTEGTLGFFTAACLQIQNLPRGRTFLSFGARDLEVAIPFARELVQMGTRPAVLRIYDPLETSLALNSQLLKEVGFEGGSAIVVIYEGLPRLVDAEVREAQDLARRLKLQELGPRLAEHWWNHRYDVSYKQQLILSHQRVILDTFEVATTWSNLNHVYHSIKKVKMGLGVILAHFSHFYHTGANIYFTLVGHTGFLQPIEDLPALKKYEAVWNDLLQAALDSGATLSHHHGVGIQKSEWFVKEKADWAIYYQKVKHAFDPKNRFNPFKMGG